MCVRKVGSREARGTAEKSGMKKLLPTTKLLKCEYSFTHFDWGGEQRTEHICALLTKSVCHSLRYKSTKARFGCVCIASDEKLCCNLEKILLDLPNACHT